MTANVTFDKASLDGLIGAVEEKPVNGQTVWQASTNWLGGFRSQTQIRDFTVTMDEPTALGGTDTAPNMVEMVLGAYGCCLTTGYVMNAGLMGIDLQDVSVELEGDLDLNGFFGLQDADQCWPGYSAIRANVRLQADAASPEQIQALHDKVVETSPVGSILTRPVAVSTELIAGA